MERANDKRHQTYLDVTKEHGPILNLFRVLMKQMCISSEETTDYFIVHMNLKNVYTWINPVVSKTEYKFETIRN